MSKKKRSRLPADSFITSCDMGSVRVYGRGLACFFANGFGDSDTKVDIYTRSVDELHGHGFLGHFTVKGCGASVGV